MAGTVVRIGRYRTSSGPDLAVVYNNQQLASFTSPASHSSRIILYRGGAWIGKYSGNPRARLGLHWTASDSSSPNNLRPGGVARYTGEMVPSTNYTGGGGGQQMFANLTEPFVTQSNYAYTISITNSTGTLGTAMYQASDISEANEWFYRKNISGNVPVDGGGSSTSNEGQLVGWFEGEVNVKPNNPTGLYPSGSNLLISRTPQLSCNFSDPNQVLNNGVAYDRVEMAEVQIRTGGTGGAIVAQSGQYTTSNSERTNSKTVWSVPSNLSYGVTYTMMWRHRDRIGLWSDWASTTFSIKDPNDPPYAPDYRTPSGNVVASNTTPSFRFRHRDPNGHSSNRANIQVQTTGGSNLWDYAWDVSVANNNYITRTYGGSALSFGTTYRWRVRTRDTGGYWGAWSDFLNFTIYKDNSAPLAPDNLYPNTTISGALTPVLSMRHRDPDGNPTSNVSMQVRRASDSVMMLDSTWATSVAHNGTVSRVYNGSTLSYNTNYQFRGRTQDNQGEWGPWSGWIGFNITSLATVDQPSSPAGYQASQIPANVVAKYTHNTGVNSQAFRVQILDGNGAVVTWSGWVNKTVASGSNVTLTYSELGIGAAPWGAKRQVRVQARDANGVEAPSWSPARAYNINAAPSTPSGLTPNGTAYSSRPILSVSNVTDADTVQHPKSSLIVKAVITTSAGTFTRTMTWIPARSRWEYQTTSADLPSQSGFQNSWQAYAGDGIVWSGGTTVEANASRSGIATFIYDAVPDVTITGPSSPIETSQPTITWTVDLTQASWIVRLYNDDNVKVYELTGSGTTNSHQITGAGWIGGEVWNTGETFHAEVVSTSTSALTGTSSRVAILLEYTPPDSLPLEGEAFALPQTTQQNAFLVWHNGTNVSNENFEGYIWRRAEVDDNNVEIDGTSQILNISMNPATTSIVDASVVSGVRYKWSVVVRERRDNDIVTSESESFFGSTSWSGIVIHAPSDPLTTAVELKWGGPGDPYAPEYTWDRPHEQFEAVSGERIFAIGKKMHRDASGTFEIRTDAFATADQRLATLDRLYKMQGGEIDGEPHTACWRSGRGGVNGIIYGVLSLKPSIVWDEHGWYTLDIGIQAASYQEGIPESEIEE